jgi:hypothetical protein
MRREFGLCEGIDWLTRFETALCLDAVFVMMKRTGVADEVRRAESLVPSATTTEPGGVAPRL